MSRAADCRPRGQGVVEQTRAPITNPERLTLIGPCASEDHLPPVVAGAALDAFAEAAVKETVGSRDEWIFALRPQRGLFLTTRALDLIGPSRSLLCLGRGLLRARHSLLAYEQNDNRAQPPRVTRRTC